jgi:hypothetical protein
MNRETEDDFTHYFNATSRLNTEVDRLRKAMETARTLIGALNDSAPPAVKESNINQAWHVLDDNLRVPSVPSA